MFSWKFLSSSMAAVSLVVLPSHAGCELDVSDYVGWTIIYAGTVTGYVDSDGTKSDDYEGCEHGRVLVIDYDKGVTCREYTYSYAYRPDVVILTRGSSAIACIDDEEIDISLN